MLRRYTTSKGIFNFVDRPKSSSSSQNIFTIIVGKNGTGKSRLLREIAIDYLRPKGGNKKFADVASSEFEWRTGQMEKSVDPSKLICVSTSPFDKFPLVKRTGTVSHYSYLGLRGLPSQNMGLAYLARIIYTLAEAATKNGSRSSAIGDVLAYLNYEPIIDVTFSYSSPTLLGRLMASHNPREEIDIFTGRSGVFSGEHLTLLRQLLTVDDRTFDRFMKAASNLQEWPKREKIRMRLTPSGVYMERNLNLQPEDVVILGQFGMLKLRDVELHKKEKSSNLLSSLMISEMSSGEQTVIMGLLGIGSQLEDGALVCIDEPEVCLHPEWQERYIQLLSRIFSHYNNCHFVIATHSPQIVAQLPDENCFVMRMEDGTAHRSKEFSKQSIDFQLATVFNAPGFKNEYLTRIALNLFIDVSKTRVFSQENSVHLNILRDSVHKLRSDDPLREVINSVEEMHRKYG